MRELFGEVRGGAVQATLGGAGPDAERLCGFGLRPSEQQPAHDDRAMVDALIPARDALATAVCVLGPERGLKLVDETEGAAALIVREDRTFESSRFPDIPTPRRDQSQPMRQPIAPVGTGL